jgi:hypothetical protein
MATNLRVIGVHPVPADQPVHLLEVELTGDVGKFDFGKVTQRDPKLPRRNWQVAYDEREIGSSRFAFFFHYLNLDQPLETQFGPVPLASETPIPDHLKGIEYEQP